MYLCTIDCSVRTFNLPKIYHRTRAENEWRMNECYIANKVITQGLVTEPFTFGKSHTSDSRQWSLSDWAKLAQWINCGTRRHDDDVGSSFFTFLVPVRLCSLAFVRRKNMTGRYVQLSHDSMTLGSILIYFSTSTRTDQLQFPRSPRDCESCVIVDILSQNQ